MVRPIHEQKVFEHSRMTTRRIHKMIHGQLTQRSQFTQMFHSLLHVCIPYMHSTLLCPSYVGKPICTTHLWNPKKEGEKG